MFVNRLWPWVAAALFACLLGLTRSGRPAGVAENSFTDGNARVLLGQMADGLVAHDARRLLRVFDLPKMTDGALFQQQIVSFFEQTDNIRVHFNLLGTSSDAGKGLATVQVEMEADRNDDRLLPLRKQARLSLVAENDGSRWRLTDIQPRMFFSTQP